MNYCEIVSLIDERIRSLSCKPSKNSSVFTGQSNSFYFTGNGTNTNPLIGNIKLDPNPENLLSITSAGLFASAALLESDPIFEASAAANITLQNITNWNTALASTITGAAFSGTDTKVLTLTKTDGSTITASFSDIQGSGGGSGSAVTSLASANGFTGTVVSNVLTIALQNAGADGTTKGQAAFNSSDFNASAGVISIDYTNGQAATSLQRGFLTSNDWTTFNNKVSPSRTLTINGQSFDLSADRAWTISGGSPTTSATDLTSGTLNDARLSNNVALLTATQTLTNKTISGASNNFTNIPQLSVTNLVSDLAGKQATLVSGTNIKTVNGTSLLGSGNITITGGGSGVVDSVVTSGSANAVAGGGVFTSLLQKPTLTTIANLRALGTGLTDTRFYTTDAGQEGEWYYDASDTTQADNTGRVIVSGTKRYKRVVDSYLNPKWYGALGDGATDDYDAIMACLNDAFNRKKAVWFPNGTFMTSKNIIVPTTVPIVGNGWQFTIFRPLPALESEVDPTIITLLSGCYLRDCQIYGNKLNVRGVYIPGGNRTELRCIRIQFCHLEGLHIGSLNNSTMWDVFAQYCRYNFRLSGTLNCTLNSCNGNHSAAFSGASDAPDGNTWRNILIDGHTRNCRFFGGIFERGPLDYMAEVGDCDTFSFEDLEFNPGNLASVYIIPGNDPQNITFRRVMFTGDGIHPNIICDANMPVDIQECTASGTGGKELYEQYIGNYTFNGKPKITLFNSTFSNASRLGSAQSGATRSFNVTERNVTVTAIANQFGGIALGSAGIGDVPSGRVARIEFTLKNIVGGANATVGVYINMSATPNRKLIGNFGEGHHIVYYTHTGTETNRLQFVAGESVASPGKSWTQSYVDYEIINTDSMAFTGTQPVKFASLALASDAETQITSSITENYRFISPLKLYNWWNVTGATKQNTLVAGTNIKTINGVSPLGSGDLVVSGSGGGYIAANGFSFFSDYLNTVPTGDYQFQSVSSGTAAGNAIQNAQDANHIGIVRITTGTDTTGRTAGIAAATASVVLFGGGVWSFETLIKVNTLATTTDNYNLYFGFIGSATVIDFTNAVAFLYSGASGGQPTGSIAGGSANWQLVTANASTRSFVDSTVPVSNSTWTKLKIVVNAAGTSAEFFINGTSVGTQTVNIPTSALRFGYSLIKNAGTTAVGVDMDYIEVKSTYTTTR